MDIITTVATSVPAINSIVGLVENIGKLVKQGAKIEAEKAIQELQKALLLLGQENLKLGAENLALKQALAKQQSETDIKKQLKFEYPNYFTVSETGQRDGPYCKCCKDNQDKLIRLTVRLDNAVWFCDVCQTNFRALRHVDMPKIAKVKLGWDSF
jgi:regulator of replication initiation timing